jgi:purine-binding chemotaxis protein CheW
LSETTLRILTFQVDQRCYGLPSADVVELVRAASVEPLPGAPATIDGVLNVRGDVVPVFNLRPRFGLPDRPPIPSDHFIVTRAGERTVVVRTDRVIDLVELPAADVRSEGAAVPGVEHLTDVARLPEGLLLICDLETFLTSAETTVELDKATAPVARGAGHRGSKATQGVTRRRRSTAGAKARTPPPPEKPAPTKTTAAKKTAAKKTAAKKKESPPPKAPRRRTPTARDKKAE